MSVGIVIRIKKIRDIERERGKKKMLLMGVSVQCLMDLVVAGISLMVGLGLFAFIASILCSAAFLHNAKDLS